MTDEEGNPDKAAQDGESRSETDSPGESPPEKRRPNANYKLSKPDTINPKDEEELVFYYNREHRLAKAPQSVRDIYNAPKRPARFSILRPLIADKPRAMLFFTILVICVGVFVLSAVGAFDNSYSVDGNKIELSAVKFEGTNIVLLKKSITGKNQPYTGAVDLAISPDAAEGGDLPFFYHRIYFTLDSPEEYRLVVPFDESSLLVILQTEKSALQIKLKTKEL
jgi:hypothetical protein